VLIVAGIVALIVNHRRPLPPPSAPELTPIPDPVPDLNGPELGR